MYRQSLMIVALVKHVGMLVIALMVVPVVVANVNAIVVNIIINANIRILQ
jgi:hypothetical protein